MTESTTPRTPTAVDRVTAVMVCHNGAEWLPRAMAALDAQERQPDRIVLVDTGSTDGSATFLTERPDVRFVALDERTGFGSAISAGLAAVSGQHELHELDPDFTVVDWVWLLHDDCAPDPDALEILVAATEGRSSIAVVGPKIRGWTDPRELREVGVTIARSGRRETGLEYNEQDQGQHDGQRDVMAVGSSGMLVRRSVWDELGGFDPYLSFFRDDVDFCWRVRAAGHRVVVVTDAVVLHAEAASRGRRDVPSRWSRPHRIDRANAMLVLLTNLRALSLIFAVPRLAFGSLVRSLGFLLGKEPGVALDELWALAIVLRHPGRIRSARRARKATRVEEPRETQRMLAPRTAQLHHAMETVAGVLSSRREMPSHVLMGAGDDGLTEEPLPPQRSLRERVATHPGVVLVTALALISLVACRHLFSGGQLLGGALLPAPSGASDLWQRFAESWHSVGTGSSMPAPPWLAVVSAMSAPFLGRPGLLLGVFVVALVPLAGWSAYAALNGVVRRPALRVWAAATYALLPATLGAIATGRIGTMVVAVLLPPLIRMLTRLWPTGRGQVSIRYAWGSGLFLALVASFVPLVWCVAAVLGLGGIVLVAVLARTSLGARAARQAAALVVAPVLLLPWSWYLLTHPALLLLEPGVADPGLTASHLNLISIVVLRPGGPGMPYWWVCGGLVVGALIAGSRRDRGRVAPSAWLIAVVGMVFGFLLAVVRVTSPTQGIEVGTWAGVVLLLAGAGALVAASSSIPHFIRGMTRAGFSWRQPLALVVALLAVASPVVIAGQWLVGGVQPPLVRNNPAVMPAFVSAGLVAQPGARVLVLHNDAGTMSYTLANSPYPVLGDVDVSQAAPAELGLAVADLVSGRADASKQLANFGVTDIVMTPPTSAAATRALDGSLGVRRVASAGRTMVWALSNPGALARLVPSAATSTAAARPVSLAASDDVHASGAIPAGWAGGTLVVAAKADAQWQASLNGVALEPTVVDGWAQGFVVPAGSTGQVTVGVSQPTRHGWLWAELVLLLIAIVLALPGRRTRTVEAAGA